MGDRIEEALALARRVVSAVEPVEVTQAPDIAEQLAQALLELSVRADRFEVARLRGENTALRYVVEMATRPAEDGHLAELAEAMHALQVPTQEAKVHSGKALQADPGDFRHPPEMLAGDEPIRPPKGTASEQCHAIVLSREGNPSRNGWPPLPYLNTSLRLYWTRKDALAHLNEVHCEGVQEHDLQRSIVSVTVTPVNDPTDMATAPHSVCCERGEPLALADSVHPTVIGITHDECLVKSP